MCSLLTLDVTTVCSESAGVTQLAGRLLVSTRALSNPQPPSNYRSGLHPRARPFLPVHAHGPREPARHAVATSLEFARAFPRVTQAPTVTSPRRDSPHPVPTAERVFKHSPSSPATRAEEFPAWLCNKTQPIGWVSDLAECKCSPRGLVWTEGLRLILL